MKNDVDQIGIKCDFCESIISDFDDVKQVVVRKKGKKTNYLVWRCINCHENNINITLDGKLLYVGKGISKDRIFKEWNSRIFNDYRRSIWRK